MNQVYWRPMRHRDLMGGDLVFRSVNFSFVIWMGLQDNFRGLWK